MNAKEQIIQILKNELEQAQWKMPNKYIRVKFINNLITAVENAIFDVPLKMEKRQIIQAAKDANNTDFWCKYESFEQYYFETFKTETE